MILGLDTSTPATVVGLLLDDGTVLDASDQRPADARPGHQEGLLELAAALLERADAGWHDVERVAVGIGPGGYTGLRVGIASARGLVQSLGAEIVGVSSLMALAHGVSLAHGSSPAVEDNGHVRYVMTIVDARRGEVFAAGHRLPAMPVGQGDSSRLAPGIVDPPSVVSAPRAVAAGQLLESFTSIDKHDGPEAGNGQAGDWLAVGNAVDALRGAVGDAGVTVPPPDSPLHRLAAAALCELGRRTAAQDIEQVLPEYCRLPDAELALAAGVGGERG